jgi:hypothetical protein
MRDFEMEFIAKRNQLILKYGEDVIKVPGYKGSALGMIRGSFAEFSDSLSFEEQMLKFESYETSTNISPLTKVQEQFVFNRYCEIIIEGKNSKGIQAKQTLKDKIEYIKNLGYTLSLTSMGETKLETGQTKNEVCSDLFDLYILEYGLYNQNSNHPIFLNAIIDGNVTPEKNNISEPQKKSSEKGGCLGVVLIMFIIIVSLIALV